MKTISTRRGFTLIELLVVISIIAMLATVILSSLGTARNKAKDVRIYSDVVQLKNLLEASFTATTGYYGDIVASAAIPTGGSYTNLNTDLASYSGTGFPVFKSDWTGPAGTNNATKWVITARLATDTTKYYCMDSVGGVSAIEVTSVMTGYVCM